LKRPRFSSLGNFSPDLVVLEKWLIPARAIFAKEKARNVEHQIGRGLTKPIKEESMEYLILVAVVAIMALYASIIVGCLKQPEW
jgi:hypothetical protein